MANCYSNTGETGRKRHNISMAEETRDRAEKLAEREKRSVSNLLEVLIDREWERLRTNSEIEIL